MFNKDILLVDIEATGLSQKEHEIIQLAAVLLDKKTLKVKKTFNSYIAPTNWKSRDPEAMKVNKITAGMLEGAPSLAQVIKKFDKAFPKAVIFAYYGGPLDADSLRTAYAKAKVKFRFDYHFFNIWGLFYSYFALKGKLKNTKRFTGFTLEDAIKHFKISGEGRHDALSDALIEAEILRMIMQDLKR